MTGHVSVRLPRKISGEKLEEVCIKVAGELGYRTKSEDEYSRSFSPGSAQIHEEYERTVLRVGNLFPAFRISGIHKGREQDIFYIWSGLFLDGFASEKEIEKYLRILSISI